ALHATPASLRLRRARADDRRRDDDAASQQASSGLCRQAQRGRVGGTGARRQVARGYSRQHLRAVQEGPQQRGRALEPQLLLGNHAAGRKPARRSSRRGDRPEFRLVRSVQDQVQRGRRRPVRLRLGVADPRPVRRSRDHLDSRAGQSADGRRACAGHAAARQRRLGACLLSQVQQPPPRISRRLVECGKLGQGRRTLRGRRRL
ncbi:MAG: Superoxide dismutase [Mn], partial [uncultured Sphingosinicella sp.]